MRALAPVSPGRPELAASAKAACFCQLRAVPLDLPIASPVPCALREVVGAAAAMGSRAEVTFALLSVGEHRLTEPFLASNMTALVGALCGSAK